MDIFEYYMKEARRAYDAASHLKTVSYQLSRDSKVFLGIVEKLHTAHKNILSLILVTDPDTTSVAESDLKPKKEFEKALERAQRVSEQQGLCDKRELEAMRKTHALVSKHEQSPVEFPRQDSFILCNNSYETENITVETIDTLMNATLKILKTLFSKRELFLSNTQDKRSSSSAT